MVGKHRDEPGRSAGLKPEIGDNLMSGRKPLAKVDAEIIERNYRNGPDWDRHTVSNAQRSRYHLSAPPLTIADALSRSLKYS